MPFNSGKVIDYRQALWDICLVIFLGLSSIKLTHNIDKVVDLILSDEPYYLYNGVNLIKQGFPTAEWSPFYAIWYWLLSIIEPTKDNLILYYFNHQVLIAATTVLLYWALRAIAVTRIIAAIITFIYLLSGVPVIWPRPTHFVLVFLLLFIIIQQYLKTNRIFLYGISITLLIVSFIRPEYFVSFIASYAVVAIREIFKLSKSQFVSKKTICFPLLIYTIVALALIGFFGIPTSSGNRSWWAFASHFALRWSWQNESNLDPWVDYEQIAASFFGDAKTIFGAMFANPPVFFSYILENLKGFFINTWDILGGNLKDNSPAISNLDSHINRIIRWSELSLLIFVILQLLRKYQLTLKHMRSRIFIRLLIITALIQVCMIPATILIFPRYHYLIINAVLFLIILGYLYSQVVTNQWQNRGWKQAIITGCLILLLTPTLAQGWCLGNACAFAPKIPTKPLLETVYFLRSLEIKQPVNLLAFDIEYRTFLGDHYNRIAPEEKNNNFQKFRTEKNLDLILVRSELSNDIRFVDDPEWQNFLTNYSLYGYQSLAIPNTNRNLLIKNELLKLSK